MAEETRTFKATCHCKASSFSFEVPTAKLPIPAYFCNCGICRRTHGTFASIHAALPVPINIDLSTFTGYASSNRAVRYFCSTCGAHMADQETTLQWNIAISMVDSEEGVWDINGHFHVESTGDGGLASLVRKIGGKEMKVWRAGSTKDPAHQETGDWKVPSAPNPQTNVPVGDKVKASCHCGGVQFFLARPQGNDAYRDMPDAMVPKDKSKWYAIHDVCDSCRLVSGCAIVSWAFPSRAALSLPDGSPWPVSNVFGTAKSYQSSTEVTRTFCATCGAIVSYVCNDRPEMIDIAAGLLEMNGVKGEAWLEWRTHKAAYEADCKWPALLEALKVGLKSGEDGNPAEGI